jgi:hypothetical protein
MEYLLCSKIQEINFEPYKCSNQLHLALGLIPIYEFILQYTPIGLRSNGAAL